MSPTVEDTLTELVAKEGAELCLDHRKVEAGLLAEHPDRPLEVVLVHLAAREGVAAELSQGITPLAAKRWVRRLFERAGVSGGYARWAIDTWARALGIDEPTWSLKPTHAPKGPRIRGIPRRPKGPPRSLRGHRRSVTALCFTPDGDKLLSTSQDRTVRVWDSGAGHGLDTWFGGHRDWIRAIAVFDKTVATGGDDGSIRLWDHESGERLTQLPGHQGPITAVTFAVHGQHIASSGIDGLVCIWDTQGLSLLHTLNIGKPVTDIVFLDNEQMLVAMDGGLELWRLGNGKRASKMKAGKHPRLALGPAKVLLVGDHSGATIIDADSGKKKLSLLKGAVTAVVVHPTGRAMALGTPDGTVHLFVDDQLAWRSDNGPAIQALAMSGQDRMAAGLVDNTILLYPMSL
ncbi:MAG: WD40 repeat domain-containing protein [Proteobacteria bacterium]|nr:WD40 repeat domain-containing protein [Pseudomonadota bacterium]